MLSLKKKKQEKGETKFLELKREMVFAYKDRLYKIESIEPDDNMNMVLFCVKIN